MKLKKEYLVLLLVIAALCAYLVTRSKDQTHFELPQLVEVESQKINRLEISKGDNTIELNKKDDQWTIGPKAYAADSIKVKNMVKAAADLKVTALVSESGNYERYDLTDDKKVRVRAYAGKETLRDFDIGRQAPTYQHTFIKLADNPKVYHARGTIDDTFNKTMDELRDETVLAYEKDDITMLTLSKGKQTLTLSKKEVPVEKQKPPGEDTSNEKKEEEQPKTEIQWKDSKDKEILKADVDLLIDDFAKLKCDDYLEDNARDGLKDPLWTVALKSDKGEYTLSVFEKENEESIEYPAISSGSPYAFILHKNRVETFEKHMDKLVNPETGK